MREGIFLLQTYLQRERVRVHKHLGTCLTQGTSVTCLSNMNRIENDSKTSNGSIILFLLQATTLCRAEAHLQGPAKLGGISRPTGEHPPLNFHFHNGKYYYPLSQKSPFSCTDGEGKFPVPVVSIFARDLGSSSSTSKSHVNYNDHQPNSCAQRVVWTTQILSLAILVFHLKKKKKKKQTWPGGDQKGYNSNTNGLTSFCTCWRPIRMQENEQKVY